MTSLSSRICSKTSLAIGLYLLALVSLVFLANAQVNAMRLFQMGQSVGSRY
jgi:hypothetical protein